MTIDTSDSGIDTGSWLENRYRLHERLGSGGMGAVYRAYDRLTGRMVALKRVHSPVGKLQFTTKGQNTEETLALTREFRFLASLRHPNIIPVYDFDFDSQGQPFFTMELLENAVTILAYSQDKGFDVKIQLIVNVLQALAYLHQRGVLHRDLKPANVLVSQSQVKVVDFGVSTQLDSESSDDMVGTLAYMAPELFLGGTASVGSDLFSLGVIAYEMLVGQHPFSGSSVTQLLHSIATDEPDLSSIDTRLVDVVAQMLAKNSLNRFSSAHAVIDALSEALDLDLPRETLSTRESYLQAAKLVGREREIAHFSELINRLEDGSGGVWLIGGESGIGKSRLISEIQIIAQVQGIHILRGQAVSEAGASYQLWRDVLRRLVLQVAPTSFEASILKALIPDLPQLLGDEAATISIPDAPPLDPDAAQTRLALVIEDLFSRHDVPTLLILEDLQWMSADSRIILKRILNLCDDQPLLILGSYRDDEPADLTDILTRSNLYKLERLSESDVSTLADAVFGAFGNESDLIPILHEETEGNVFFIVEYLRELLDTIDVTDDAITPLIPRWGLPGKMLPGGVQKIVQRRLHRVPDELMPFLQLAAVIGRSLDDALLSAAELEVDVESAKLTCANLSVLEVAENRWRFAHDKLREGLLAEMEPERRSALHHTAAIAIERVYPGVPEYFSALVLHWRTAGDTAKARHYARLAGEETLRKSSFRDAVTFLEQGLAGNLDVPTETRVRRLLGQAYFGLGDLNAAQPHLLAAARLHRHPIPNGRWALRLSTIRQIVRQFIGLARPRTVHPSDSSEIQEVLRVYEQLSYVYYWQRIVPQTLYIAVSALNLADQLPPSSEQVKAYAMGCVIAGLAGRRRLALHYAQQARDAAERIDDKLAFAASVRVMGVILIGYGDWAALEHDGDIAISAAREAQDFRVLGDNLTERAFIAWLQGDVVRSRAFIEEVRGLVKRTNNVQQQNWLNLFDLLHHYHLNDLHALEHLAVSIIDQQLNPEFRADLLLGFIEAVISLVDEDYAAAYQSLLKLEFSTSVGLIFTDVITISVLTELVLRLMPHHPGDVQLRRRALENCKQLKSLMRRYPIAASNYHLYQGWYDMLNAEPDSAHKHWQKASEAARNYNMLNNEGIAYMLIGQHIPAGHSDRQSHLKRARELFTRTMGQRYLVEVEGLLNQDGSDAG